MKPEAPGVRALDDRRLEIQLERPTSYVLGLMFASPRNLVSPRVAGRQANVLDRRLTRYLSLKP